MDKKSILMGNTCLPTVIEMEHEHNIENRSNIEYNMMLHKDIFIKLLSEALARGNEVTIKCHNGKIFIYELAYQE